MWPLWTLATFFSFFSSNTHTHTHTQPWRACSYNCLLFFPSNSLETISTMNGQGSLIIFRWVCLSIKARNLCLSVCLSVCLCVFASDISADQDQTDLRLSIWLLCGSRVCKVAFVWPTMIPLINYFRNALRIPLSLLTIATIVTCSPEPITAHHCITWPI